MHMHLVVKSVVLSLFSLLIKIGILLYYIGWPQEYWIELNN
jgi:hypothetical protein